LSEPDTTISPGSGGSAAAAAGAALWAAGAAGAGAVSTGCALASVAAARTANALRKKKPRMAGEPELAARSAVQLANFVTV
jgi:hypothetical protein